MSGICPDLVQALQASRENEGDSERLRIALNGMDLLAVDSASETLMVMGAASVQVKNGRPQITMICQRVATGNEYRDWQQSGSVPQFAGDAGSSPAVGATMGGCDNELVVMVSESEVVSTKYWCAICGKWGNHGSETCRSVTHAVN